MLVDLETPNELKLTIPWNIYPDTVLVERFFVSIESLEAAFNITRAGSIH